MGLSGIYQVWICEHPCIYELMRMRHEIVNWKNTMDRCVHSSGITIHMETYGSGCQHQGSISLGTINIGLMGEENRKAASHPLVRR